MNKATSAQINVIIQYFEAGRIAKLNFDMLPDLSCEEADKIIINAECEKKGAYFLIDQKTKELLSGYIREGRLPGIKESDLEGMTMIFAESLKWMAERNGDSELKPKQRARIRKLIEKGFLTYMSDAEISALSCHDADVLIQKGSMSHESEIYNKHKANDKRFVRKE